MTCQRLVSSPIIEASEVVEKLSGREDRNLRMKLFSLQKFIRVSALRGYRIHEKYEQSGCVH